MSGAWGGRGPDHIYATPAQESYLRRLLQQAAKYRCAPYAIDLRNRILKSDASKAIDDLRTALARAAGGKS